MSSAAIPCSLGSVEFGCCVEVEFGEKSSIMGMVSRTVSGVLLHHLSHDL